MQMKLLQTGAKLIGNPHPESHFVVQSQDGRQCLTGLFSYLSWVWFFSMYIYLVFMNGLENRMVCQHF